MLDQEVTGVQEKIKNYPCDPEPIIKKPFKFSANLKYIYCTGFLKSITTFSQARATSIYAI